jgi:hypothetical protein
MSINLSIPLGGGARGKLQGWILTRPALRTRPPSRHCTMKFIAHMAIALRLITLAFAPAPEVGIKPACAALRREWWAWLRPVFSVSDPRGQAAREPAGADRVRFRDHAAEARSAWRPSPRKSRRTRTDTETMSGALCGTDGSNPVPSSGESPANLSFRRIEVQGRSREADGDSRFWRQVLEGCQIPRHALANRLVVTAQPLGKPSATTLEQLLVQRHKARRPRYRHQQVSADPADQPFVVWAKLASLAEEL